jgi:histidinol-phosphate phosphatase family protein
MKTVFLDRDGVINQNHDGDYVKTWGEFEFIPGAKEAIKDFTIAHWDVIIVSNQACIGKGIVSADVLDEIHIRMEDEIADYGGQIKAIYYCPHRAEENCLCRKPKPGMLLEAALDLGINLSDSYLVGDNITDIQAGAEVGCVTVLVKTGLGIKSMERSQQWTVKPHYILSDLFHAAEFIVYLDFLRSRRIKTKTLSGVISI